MRNAAAQVVSMDEAGPAPSAKDAAPHVRLSVKSPVKSTVAPSSEIFLNIAVDNTSSLPLCWGDDGEINLSYHWINASTGEAIIYNGARASLKGFVAPGEKRTVALAAFAPDHEVDAILRITLVHENHFWFDEHFPETAIDLPFRIAANHWVDAPSATRSERAMRGSVAAVALAIACEGAQPADVPVEVAPEQAELVASPSGPGQPAPPARRERRHAARLRTGLQRVGAAALSPVLWVYRPLARGFNGRFGKLVDISHTGRRVADLDNRTQEILSRLDQAQALSERLSERLDDLVHMHAGAETQQSRTLNLAQSSADTGRKALLNSLHLLDRLSGLETQTASVRDTVERGISRSEALDTILSTKLDHLVARNVIPLPEGLILCRNPRGLLAVPSSDAATVAYLSDGVLPEAGTLSVVERLLPKGGCFVDIGANVGLFTLVAGQHVGERGRVVAFEPTPSTLQALHTTIWVNGLRGRVTVHEVAAGATSSQALLHLSATSGHNSLVAQEGGEQCIEVPVVRVDDLLDGLAVDMVKIDVEGWELSVLEGLSRTIAANPDIVVIVECAPSIIAKSGIDVQTWLQQLKKYNLKIFEIGENAGEVRPLRSRGLEEVGSINLLLTRKTPTALIKDAA